MKKELSKQEELVDFLCAHCEIKSTPSKTSGNKKIYIFHTRDCAVFMADAYILGMRNAIGQNEEKMIEAKKKGDFSNIIMVYNWSAPDPGMDAVHIPESLVNKLSKEQADIFLRNLQRIQADMDEGTARKKALHELFGGKATITVVYALSGERQFLVVGTESVEDKRGYAERYAEMAATNTLFDLAKAANASLQAFLPEQARDKYFIEGRSGFHKKMRYGTEAQSELLISDEATATLVAITKDSSKTKSEIRKILERVVMDPVGLSLKYYLGKHALIKLPGSEE